jgi:nitrite reductase/ring-hydroxylating ferredoxin subunit
LAENLQEETMKNRFRLYILLFASLLTFVVALVVVLIQYAIPGKEWVQVGVLSDFPPSKEPYRLQNLGGFLVNLEGELFVLSNHPPHPRFHDTCLIYWDAERQRLTEPCGGAAFALDGHYLFGPSPRGLDKYPYEIRGNEIWVETTTLILGTFVPTTVPDTPIPVTP